MIRKEIFVFISLFVAFSSQAQLLPKENQTLNYTKVLFSFPQIPSAEKYLIEVSEDSTFQTKIFLESPINAKIIPDLNFGKTYFWRYSGFDANKKSLALSTTNTFHIGSNDFTSPKNFSYTQKKMQRGACSPGLIFMDYGRVAINRRGEVQWYLPEYPFLLEQELVRDFKFTPDGTITVLLDSIACEMNLEGEILWQAPFRGVLNGEASENYHHDFMKLPNGNYMVLGTDHVYRFPPDKKDSVLVEFGTVIEYDYYGNIVWSWNSNEYFTDQDLFSKTRTDKSYDTGLHMNAFSAEGDFVNVGFRDISRIVTIQKSTGKVIASYGQKGNSTEVHGAEGFFRRQHDAYKLKDGNFAVINNDSIMDRSIVSSLVIFSPLSGGDNSSKKIFEFKFDFDTLTNGKSAKMGNLQELDNGNILINMGGINRCIEITREGQVVWDLFMEKYDMNMKNWMKFPNYRVNYTPTLYPHVFRQKIINDVKKRGMRTVTLEIYNIGDLSDTYDFELRNTEGKLIFENSPTKISIAPGASQTVKLKFKNKKKQNILIKTSSSLCFNNLTIPAKTDK